MYDPGSLAFDAAGRLIVADELGLRVQAFEDGVFAETILDERDEEPLDSPQSARS